MLKSAVPGDVIDDIGNGVEDITDDVTGNDEDHNNNNNTNRQKAREGVETVESDELVFDQCFCRSLMSNHNNV